MNLSKPIKILLGLLTLWPFLYAVLFVLIIVGIVLSAASGEHPMEKGRFPSGILVIFVLHLLTMLLSIGLLFFYIVYLFKTNRVGEDKKVLWAVVLFFGKYRRDGSVFLPFHMAR